MGSEHAVRHPGGRRRREPYPPVSVPEGLRARRWSSEQLCVDAGIPMRDTPPSPDRDNLTQRCGGLRNYPLRTKLYFPDAGPSPACSARACSIIAIPSVSVAFF